MDLIGAFDDISKTVTNIYKIEEYKLSSAKLKKRFWTAHSLPLYKGGTANRYNHPSFTELSSWDDRFNSYLNNPVKNFLKNNTTSMLSPIEKYELIIDSNNETLALNEWVKGKEYKERQGSIPSWVGACHGTAPSSIIHPRPKSAVSVLSSNGQNVILFYPSDIKALLAYAWTTNAGPSAVMGSRCQYYKNSCQDTNPASFHLALTNLIGLNQKALIIDTDSGPQVWNRPVVSYQFDYFNPQFRNYTRTISRSIINLDQYTEDPYKQQRAPGAKKIVGVRARIDVINDNAPSTDLTDSYENDSILSLVYLYDLELDAEGEILGGEWHQSSFPDFVWVVSENIEPLSYIERSRTKMKPNSSGLTSLPSELQDIARDSRKAHQVSYWVIEYLLNLSN